MTSTEPTGVVKMTEDERREKQRAYRADNLDKIRAAQQAYRAANLDKIRAVNRTYRKAAQQAYLEKAKAG